MKLYVCLTGGFLMNSGVVGLEPVLILKCFKGSLNIYVSLCRGGLLCWGLPSACYRGEIHNLFMWYKMCSAQYDRLCDMKYACSIVDDIHCIVYSTLIILYYSVKSTWLATCLLCNPWISSTTGYVAMIHDTWKYKLSKLMSPTYKQIFFSTIIHCCIVYHMHNV